MHYGLHNLSPSPGSRKIAKRVGRGLSGGAMCGRGNAGQNSRSGPGPCTGFAGGQTPLWQRFPKLGRMRDNAPTLLPVSLELIQHLILMKRVEIKKGGYVEQTDIFRAVKAACSQGLQGIKIVTDKEDGKAGSGTWFDHRLCIIAGGFSQEAVRRIEDDLGGHAVSVYHSPPSFRGMLNKGQVEFEPPMTHVLRIRYSSWSERGYLNERVRDIFRNIAPAEHAKYIHVPPMYPSRLPPLTASIL